MILWEAVCRSNFVGRSCGFCEACTVREMQDFYSRCPQSSTFEKVADVLFKVVVPSYFVPLRCGIGILRLSHSYTLGSINFLQV